MSRPIGPAVVRYRCTREHASAVLAAGGSEWLRSLATAALAVTHAVEILRLVASGRYEITPARERPEEDPR